MAGPQVKTRTGDQEVCVSCQCEHNVNNNKIVHIPVSATLPPSAGRDACQPGNYQDDFVKIFSSIKGSVQHKLDYNYNIDEALTLAGIRACLREFPT